MTKFIAAIFLFLTLQQFSDAQESTEITAFKKDQKSPAFHIRQMIYPDRKNVNLNDFFGKWLILDFWNKHCIACIRSFPKMNVLIKKFAGKVNLVMIGEQDRENQIQGLYEQFRKRLNLELTVAFDSNLFRRFDIGGCPYIVVIDENGIVRAITGSLDETELAEILAGKSPPLLSVLNKSEQELRNITYDSDKPLLIQGNGGNDTAFLFRSVLTNWTPDIPQAENRYLSPYTKNKIQLTGITLFNLYQVAFGDTLNPEPAMDRNCYGKWWMQPVVESSDSTFFKFDYKTGKNIFCYSLIVPRGQRTTLQLQQNMQRDLENYFGYTVEIQKRKMPCYFITASESAKQNLISKGGKSLVGGDGHTSCILINQPIKTLITCIWAHNQDKPPFIDKTGIEDNIDIKVYALLNDLNELKTSFRKNGLDILTGIREMKVIVIKDSESKQKGTGRL